MLISFVLAHSLLLRVTCFSSETPLEKTRILFADQCQLETAFDFGMGVCVTSSDYPRASASSEPGSPYACYLSIYEFLCALGLLYSGLPWCLPSALTLCHLFNMVLEL